MGSESPDGGAAPEQRVGRPRRLTTDEVVNAAVEIADEGGLESLSMPSLARHLGVGTMTLYGYVQNKEDLLDRMAARLFDGLQTRERQDWREGLFAFFADFREAALAHPTLARLLATGRITIPAVFDILESFFQDMKGDGLSVDEAVRIFYAGLTYTVGFVLWEIPRVHLQPPDAYADQWADLVARLDAADYPMLTGPALPIATTVASTTQYEWGLHRILDTGSNT